ncbi:MAG: DUF2079 domain-containing protein [Actinomycetota bacterium]|nr:DUF2079 domain-containing protein [Actinomycetota bacterium]
MGKGIELKEKKGNIAVMALGTNPLDGNQREKKLNHISLAVLLVLVIGYIVLFSLLSIYSHSNLRAPSYDTAIFSQVVWKLSHFKEPVSTLRGMNFFGDHMVPILFLLVPLYWVGADTIGLLVVQTVAIAAGALILYLLARRKIGGRWVPVCVSVSYLLYPALQNMNLFAFHPEAIATFFFLSAVLAVDDRKFGWFFACSILAMVCKEDMALAILVLGVVVYFKYDRRVGMIASIGSFAYFLLAILVIMPLFSPEGYQYTSRLSLFGETTFEAIKNFLIRPLRTADILSTRMNLRYIFDLFMPVAFISFFSPIYLLPALPAFVINIVSDFAPQHTILCQYTAAITPFVFAAGVFGLKKFKEWAGEGAQVKKVLGAVGGILLACSLAGNFYLSPSPLSEKWTSKDYVGDSHVKVVKEGLSKIPSKASVSAQRSLLVELSCRDELYEFPNPFIDYVSDEYYKSLGKLSEVVFPGLYQRREGKTVKKTTKVPRVDYVALDEKSISYPLDEAECKRLEARLVNEGGYVQVFRKDGVVILKRI